MTTPLPIFAREDHSEEGEVILILVAVLPVVVETGWSSEVEKSKELPKEAAMKFFSAVELVSTSKDILLKRECLK
jgi:hypothetical protein